MDEATVALVVAPATTAECDPWLVAKSRYLEGLNSEERALFNDATIENLYYKTSNDSRDERKRKSSSAISKLEPLVAALKDYSEALDVFANISPLGLSPIWGSIRVLLVLAEKYDKFYKRIVDVLSRIGDLLPRLKDYGRIFDLRKHARLRQSLSETYLDIINLCKKIRQILHDQTQVSLKRFSRPLLHDAQYEEALEQFRRHKKTVEKEAENCHMIEAAESRALILRNKELQELRERAERRRVLLSQLSMIDYESRHRKLRAVRHGDTGAWLRAEPGYVGWIGCDTTSVLCCYGIPGCGKSVLASSVIDTLVTSSEPSCVAYYFCDYADKRTLDTTSILGTISRQLLEKAEMTPNVEKLITDNYSENRSPTWSAAADVLLEFIRLYPAFTLILDGLDELDEENRKILFSALNRLDGEVGSNLKLFISCREDVIQSLRIPETNNFRVHIKPLTLSHDIGNYISYTVGAMLDSGDMVVQDCSLKEVIIEKLVGGAQGMFLWVKFQLDDLCDAESDAEIKRVLDDLPKDLSETYARLLGRITGSQRQKLAKKMLQWIVGARRPLKIEELREGIAFTLEDKFFNREKLPTDMPRLIRGCGNLVVINEDTEEVHLAHYTVQQYILQESAVDCGEQNLPYVFTSSEVNNTICETCLAYLSFSDFETQISCSINKNMMEMAVFQRATVSGVSANTGRLGNTMRQALAFVNRAGPSTLSNSPSIDYQRLILRREKPSPVLFELYHLLKYVVENWLFHTTDLKCEGEAGANFTEFKTLICRKKLPFKFCPWELSSPTENPDQIFMLGWALEMNHLPVLLSRLDLDPLGTSEFGTSRLIDKACHAENCRGQITKERIADFDSLSQLRTVRADNETKLAWLYSKLILACRQGNSRVLSYLVNANAIGNRYAFAISHLIWGAASNGQKEVVKCILEVYHQCLYPSIAACEYSGYYLNATDIAILRGYPEIAKIINNCYEVDFKKLFRVLSNCLENILKNNAAVDAILEVVNPQSQKEEDRLHFFHYKALLLAMSLGDISRMTRYARTFKVGKLLESGFSPLVTAVMERNPLLIKTMINFGPDIEDFWTFSNVYHMMDIAIYDPTSFEAIFEVFKSRHAPQWHALLYKLFSEASKNGFIARVQRYLRTFDLERNVGFMFFGQGNPVRFNTPLMVAIFENNSTLVGAFIRAGASTESLLCEFEGSLDQSSTENPLVDAILDALSTEDGTKVITVVNHYRNINSL